MRQRLDEPRQVRKEAAVIAIGVCCGVPGLLFPKYRNILTVNIYSNFRLPEFDNLTKR